MNNIFERNNSAIIYSHQHPNQKESQHRLWLATSEADQYFHVRLPYKKSLLATTIKHIGSLTNQAQNDSVYAIMKLAKWKRVISNTQGRLQHQCNEIEKALTNHIRQQRIHPPKRYMHTIHVGNSTIAMIANTITDYDYTIWLLGCASYANMFDSINHYFQAKTRVTSKLNRMFSNIIHERIDNISRITVMDYLNNEARYIKMKKHYRAIKPTVLLQAIKTSVQLDYPAKEMQDILDKLTAYCSELKQ